MGGGERQQVQGAAAGVNVQRQVAQRHQIAGEVVGDALGEGAGGAAGKGAIEVALVDRRGAGAVEHRRVVHHRHDDHPPANVLGAQTARQLEQGGDAFVFVTVVATGEQGGGAVAVAHHRDRNHQAAPGGVVVGVRQLEKTVLHTVAVEIHGGGDRAVLHDVSFRLGHDGPRTSPYNARFRG